MLPILFSCTSSKDSLINCGHLSTDCFYLQVSNRFYFTFTVRQEAKAKNNGVRIRKVVPATEEEARRIIERIDADSLDSSI